MGGEGEKRDSQNLTTVSVPNRMTPYNVTENSAISTVMASVFLCQSFRLLAAWFQFRGKTYTSCPQ